MTTPPFTIAHLTDPHLPLLPRETRLCGAAPDKRLSGKLSWRMKRRHIHLPGILAQLIADIRIHQPQHIIVTGDLLNISLAQEYARAATWLGQLGAPEDVSLTPGNHDAYMPAAFEAGAAPWAPYMQSDAPASGAPFPYCRIRGEIALIGVSTAVPTRVFSAAGEVGIAQLAALAGLLARLGKADLMRIVMLHHPPGSAGAPPRKGLRDRAALLEVMAQHGAELMLHGHTHRGVFDQVPGPQGPIPVLAPSSASSLDPHGEHARWHLLEISRLSPRQWQTHITVRGYNPPAGQFETQGQFSLLAER